MKKRTLSAGSTKSSVQVEGNHRVRRPEGWESWRTTLQQRVEERKKRNADIAEIEKAKPALDALLRLLADESRPKPVRRHFNDSFADGFDLPLRVMFMPDRFCSVYDELSVCPCTDMLKFVNWAALHPNRLNSDQIKLLCRYVSVTSSEDVAQSITPLLQRLIIQGKCTLFWKDVQEMLVNLGLCHGAYTFDSRRYYNIPTTKGLPKYWNFQIIFFIIQHSFRDWQVSQMLGLVQFLSGCLFEVSVITSGTNVVRLLHQVLKFLVENGCSTKDVVQMIDQSHISVVCNRHLILLLCGNPLLHNVVSDLSFLTVFKILQCEVVDGNPTLCAIAQALDTWRLCKLQMDFSSLTQVVMICVNLVCRFPYSNDSGTLLTSLSSVIQYMLSRVSPTVFIYLTAHRITLDVVTESFKSGSGCCDSQNFSDDDDHNVNHFPAMARFMQNCFHCCCRDSCTPSRATGFVADHISNFLINRFDLCLADLDLLTSFISAEVLATPQLLHLLLSKYPSRNVNQEHQVRTVLELHHFYHPPCRPGMGTYYFSVLNSHQGESGLPMFLYVFREFHLAITQHGVPPGNGSSDGAGSQACTARDSDSLFTVDKLRVLFNYCVHILCEDSLAALQGGRVPIVIKLVWGSADCVCMNSHCQDLIDMYIQAPVAFRRDIGLYLTLLAGALHKGKVLKEYSFWSIGSVNSPANELVEAFVSTVLDKNQVLDYNDLIPHIPSSLFRCQLLQRLIYHQLRDKGIKKIGK